MSGVLSNKPNSLCNNSSLIFNAWHLLGGPPFRTFLLLRQIKRFLVRNNHAANPKVYRELPVSQFSKGKTCFHYRKPCSHCRDPVFITGISLQNPVLPCTGLQCRQEQNRNFYKINVWNTIDKKGRKDSSTAQLMYNEPRKRKLWPLVNSGLPKAKVFGQSRSFSLFGLRLRPLKCKCKYSAFGFVINMSCF